MSAATTPKVPAGRVFRTVREAKGMTQEEVGVLVGRSARHVSRIERSDLAADDWDVHDLARALGQHMAKVAARP